MKSLVNIMHRMRTSIAYEFACCIQHERGARGFTRHTKIQNANGGFTLIELLVVIVIIMLVSGVILVQSNSSRSDLLLTNEAYEVALLMREAQSFGVAVREQEGGGSFEVGYGVYVDTSNTNQLILYNNLNIADSLYNPGEDIIVGNPLTLDSDAVIADICGIDASGGEVCASDGDVSNINVTFTRPDPDAVITINETTVYSGAKFYLQSPSGGQRTVTVFATGQIAVE